MIEYLNAFICLLLIFACIQVLNIFKTTRWVLSVLSHALSQLLVFYTLCGLFFYALAMTSHLAYGDSWEELSTIDGSIYN
jgi:hypothetical protein